MKKLLFSMVLGMAFLTGCADDNGDWLDEEEEVYDDGVNVEVEETDAVYEEEVEESPYTEEELEADPSAPSTDTEDYNSDGEYVPEDGPSDNPGDYNSDGEYKPVEDMTQDEIEAELEEFFDDSLGN
ncbi:MAG: hypothetical protein ACQEWW_16850 [Bacillota bacterium]